MAPPSELVTAQDATEISARLGVPIWTRRDGTQVALDTMEDRHLVNAIAILQPWRRDCLRDGRHETARAIKKTLEMIRLEQRRRKRREKSGN